jgi:hypothetical protein
MRKERELRAKAIKKDTPVVPPPVPAMAEVGSQPSAPQNPGRRKNSKKKKKKRNNRK